MTQMTRALPEFLHPAYDWTAAAGEIEELTSLRGAKLKDYARRSAANCVQNGEADVTVSDIIDLSEWLSK